MCILIAINIQQAHCFQIVYMHYMTTDNELIKYQMAFGSHFVTRMHIFVTLCPVYESLSGYLFPMLYTSNLL